MLKSTKGYVFESPFVINSVEIEKKDILNYIKGKSQPIIGDDFYYSYVYKDGVLSFVSFASKKYIAGELPVVAPALLQKGKYFYNPGGNIYYFIENSHNVIKTEVGYEKREGYDDITAVGESVRDIPDTLRLKWSLQTEYSRLNLIGIIAFALSVIFVLVSNNYKDSTKQATAYSAPATETKKQRLLDITGKIMDIGREVEGKGYIEKMQIQTDELLFVIRFNDETYAHSFISRYGGKYENNAVIYTATGFNSK